MGFKEKLKNILKEFNELKSDLRTEINDINKSNMYSEEYKLELIKKAKQKAMLSQDELKGKALKIIEIAKQELLNKKGTMNKDNTFEVKLSNALKVLETIGADMTVEELEELVKPFCNDYYTMKMLRRIFSKYNLKGIQEIFGIDVIDHNLSSLESLEKDLSNILTSDIEKANIMKLIISIEMMDEIK